MKVAILITFLSLLAFAKPVLKVHPVVLVEGSQVFLSDLIDMKDVPAETAELLSKVVLAPAPESSQVLRYSNIEISKILRQSLIRLPNVQMQIPNEVLIRAKGSEISHYTVKDAIIHRFKDMCPDCEVEVSDVVLPAMNASLKYHEWRIDTGTQIKPAFTYPIEILENNRVIYRTWVTGSLKVYKTVPVLSRDIDPSDRFQPKDYEYKRKDVSFSVNKTAPRSDEMAGAKPRRSMRSGDIVWTSDLVREKAVRSGDPVEIFIKAETWRITLKGVANQEGYIGDSIKVSNPQTKKVFVGKVISAGMVEVQ